MEKVRTSLLVVIFGSVFFFLGRTILAPSAAKSTVTPFAFPTAVPLPGWQLKNSSQKAAPIADPTFVSGRHYQYIQNDLTLDIEMGYIVNTKGDVNSFIQYYSSMPPPPGKLSPVLRQQSGVGLYSLFAYQQRAYLSSCINSRGGSTVTDVQFRQNRDIYDNIYNMRFKERLLPWLQGRGSIRDMRCVWAHLSIPLKNSSPEDAYVTLEKAWESWYQWWYPRFPQP